MLATYVFDLFFRETDLASGRPRRRRRPEPAARFVGGYSYKDDLMLHPRYMPRPAAFPGDWEVRYKNLRLDSAFRCQQGIREPLEEPSDIEAELRRVFGDADQPLRDDPANGLRYHLLLVVPTPHCGIVSWECPGKPDVLLNYTPAYSDSVHPLPGLLALAQAETVRQVRPAGERLQRRASRCVSLEATGAT